jgi:predicted outer membrane protein
VVAFGAAAVAAVLQSPVAYGHETGATASASQVAASKGPTDMGAMDMGLTRLGPAAMNVAAVLPAAQPDEPLTAADRDLVVKVRLAGLWEMQAGQMAATKGVNPRVREIGAMIRSQHIQLDALDVQAANELGITLPNEPNSDQKGWLAEMRAASGAQFDHVFVDRLRAAHGKVFSVIAGVRAGTHNTVVRQLAQSSNGFVLTHLTLLESTGLVDFGKLPAAPAPAAATPATAPVSSSVDTGPFGAVSDLAHAAPWYVWIIGAAMIFYGGWTYLRTLRGRQTAGVHTARGYDPAPRAEPPAVAAFGQAPPYPDWSTPARPPSRLRDNPRLRP